MAATGVGHADHQDILLCFDFFSLAIDFQLFDKDKEFLILHYKLSQSIP